LNLLKNIRQKQFETEGEKSRWNVGRQGDTMHRKIEDKVM
jgi:hypothetical protein